MLQYKVLLVDDSEEICLMVQKSTQGLCSLDWADNLETARTMIKENRYDLILLDIGLPDGTGYDFCVEAHAADPLRPIFFLTSQTSVSEKVMAFANGADDFITKPFAPMELRARVEACLRRLQLRNTSSRLLEWDELEIDTLSQEVRVQNGGPEKKKIDLTKIEYQILTYFSQRPNEVLPRDQILNDIWGEDVHVYSRSVDTHVSKLRKKLGQAGEVIESVHGVGYKFKPNPAR